MKIIFTILLAVLIVRCSDNPNNVDSAGNKRPKNYEKYDAEFKKYIGEHSFWYERFMCNVRCRNVDSMSISRSIMNTYHDSANKYYALMYPYGNPADKKESEKDNCNCK